MDEPEWDEAFRLFHLLWGKSKDGEYSKSDWMKLQILLEKARMADGVTSPSRRPPPPA